MNVLLGCKYRKDMVIPTVDGHTVIPNVIFENEEVDNALVSNLIGKGYYVTFTGNSRFNIPEGINNSHVFSEYTMEELESDIELCNPGVTNIIHVSDGVYPDLRLLVSYCNMGENIRVIGGNLLCVDGLRVGRIEGNKPLVCSGVYDSFIEADESELSDMNTLLEKIKQAEKSLSKAMLKSNKSKSSNSSKKSPSQPSEPKKPSSNSKKATAFSNLFGFVEDF